MKKEERKKTRLLTSILVMSGRAQSSEPGLRQSMARDFTGLGSGSRFRKPKAWAPYWRKACNCIKRPKARDHVTCWKRADTLHGKTESL